MSSIAVYLFLLVGILSIPAVLDNVYGHGLGGDVAPPIDFGGDSVTVSTKLNPSDITVGEINSANMEVRFYNADTNETFEKVTYRIEVWRSGDLLARNLFYDDDGELNIEVRPVLNCTEPKLWKCTTYGGSEHVSAPGALYVFGNGRPLITGPIFDKGGLYNIRVDVEGATSPKTIVAQALSYDTFVSVAQEQPFSIQTASASVPVVVKTYYDEVDNFNYDPADDSITFDMPFDWSPDYIQYVSVVHEELQFPKTFTPYSEDKQFKGYVDGVEVEQRVLLIDPYSYEDKNVVHFLVSGQELQRINDVLGQQHQQSKMMEFKLVPHSGVSKNTFQSSLVDIKTLEQVGTVVNVSWDSQYGAGDEIPFEITFFDDNQNLIKDVRYAYYLIDPNENIILEKGTNPDDPNGLGIFSPEGIDYQTISLPTADIYRLDIRVLGTGINYDPTYAGIASVIIDIGPSGILKPDAGATQSDVGDTKPDATTKPATDDAKLSQPETISIPGWVKSNAAWWAEGGIDDASFAKGIEFMIKNGIISIPPTEAQTNKDAAIPDWVKNNAAWWAEGQISDDDFVRGLQHLIANGIIAI